MPSWSASLVFVLAAAAMGISATLDVGVELVVAVLWLLLGAALPDAAGIAALPVELLSVLLSVVPAVCA